MGGQFTTSPSPTGRSLEVRAFLHRFVDLAPVGEAIKCFLPILTESNAAAMAFDGRSTFDTPVQQVQQFSIDPYDRLQGIMPERCACCTAPSPLIH